MLLQEKNALVTGVANESSIAWGIARAFKEHGACVYLCVQTEEVAEKVRKFAGGMQIFVCDLTDEDQVRRLAVSFQGIHVHILVHAAAFAPPITLKGDPLDHLSKENFIAAMLGSVFSFLQLLRWFEVRLADNASVITLTHLGGRRAFQNYNIMGPAKAALEASVRMETPSLGRRGIRVNAISPPAIRTLSSRAITDVAKLIDLQAQVAPIRRKITPEDVGNTAVYLASDLSSAVTGQVHEVDGGFSILGVTALA